MEQSKQIELEIRQATPQDNLEEIAALIYKTDEYIYPYWFESLEKCQRELPPLMLEDNFFFNVNNFYIAIDKSTGQIVGATCIVDKNTKLDYDYTKLREVNERYKFTIDNYIKGLIEEVKDVEFAYISNVCVDENYRGQKIGNRMMSHVIEIYRQKKFQEMMLDLLAKNPGAIKLYQNLGFIQSSDIFPGFNDPEKEKPEVFSMKSRL